jgi:hypothetical protein
MADPVLMQTGCEGGEMLRVDGLAGKKVRILMAHGMDLAASVILDRERAQLLLMALVEFLKGDG